MSLTGRWGRFWGRRWFRCGSRLHTTDKRFEIVSGLLELIEVLLHIGGITGVHSSLKVGHDGFDVPRYGRYLFIDRVDLLVDVGHDGVHPSKVSFDADESPGLVC